MGDFVVVVVVGGVVVVSSVLRLIFLCFIECVCVSRCEFVIERSSENVLLSLYYFFFFHLTANASVSVFCV